MKNIICILAIVFFISGCEKTTDSIQERGGIVFLPNENEPFTGKFERHYSNGQIEIKGNFKNGKPIGLLTRWYENGQIAYKGNLKDGKPTGLLTRWYKNGQKESEENYEDGKLNGLVTEWDENGQKKSEE